MSIQTEKYEVRAQFLEGIVIEDLKKAANYKVLGIFTRDAFCVSLGLTLGSLFFFDKRVTLISGGLTAALTFLANSYFSEKYKSNVLNREVEALKHQARKQDEKKSNFVQTGHSDSQKANFTQSGSINNGISNEQSISL